MSDATEITVETDTDENAKPTVSRRGLQIEPEAFERILEELFTARGNHEQMY